VSVSQTQLGPTFFSLFSKSDSIGRLSKVYRGDSSSKCLHRNLRFADIAICDSPTSNSYMDDVKV
jgi:hypothetical protein